MFEFASREESIISTRGEIDNWIRLFPGEGSKRSKV